MGTALLWRGLDGGDWAVSVLGLPAGTRVDAVLPSILVASLALVSVSLMTRPRPTPTPAPSPLSGAAGTPPRLR